MYKSNLDPGFEFPMETVDLFKLLREKVDTVWEHQVKTCLQLCLTLQFGNNAVGKESVSTVQNLGENDCGFFFVFILHTQVYLFVIPYLLIL